ncbi:MAG: tail fiber assembly protein [Janthinobacterium lividum]
MLIHQYDHLTGQYLNSGLADEDPREAGRWLIPAFSTTQALPPRPSRTWPFLRNGAWTLLPDHRGRVLYRCSNGQPSELLAAGTTPEENGLTDQPRPSPEHVWNGKTWALDPVATAARVRRAAMAQFETRLHIARQKNHGKADAYAAGLLNDEEIYYFKAWSAYQMDLVRAIDKESFPEAVEWPAEPGPYEPPAASDELVETPALGAAPVSLKQSEQRGVNQATLDPAKTS